MDNTILSCTNFNSQLTQSIMPASNGSTHAARFTDKVAIVTGGSSGMGREASLALAKGEPLCLDFPRLVNKAEWVSCICRGCQGGCS